MPNSATAYICPMPPVPALPAPTWDSTLCDDCQEALPVAGGQCQDCIDAETAAKDAEQATFEGYPG